MRVALDATPLTVPTGGTTRYASELIRALATDFPEDEFILVSDQPFQPPGDSLPNLRCGRGPRNALERRWWLWGLERELGRLGADVFHGTDFAVPYVPRRPSVMTVHDLSPWMEPSWHCSAARVRRRAPFLLRLGLAALVVTVSEAVRRQAIDYFGLAPRRVIAVPPAASRVFQPARPPERRPYFLYAGTLEPRKNLPMLVEAWREVRRSNGVDLILAGRRREDCPQFGPEPGLTIVSSPSDEELCSLYSGALAFVYPSLYEGFGLPVLEAMQCGAAVITSNDPALAETSGGAAILCEARDARAWVEAMTTAARRPDWVASWRERSLARARCFSWAAAARRMREAYEQAMRQFGG